MALQKSHIHVAERTIIMKKSKLGLLFLSSLALVTGVASTGVAGILANQSNVSVVKAALGSSLYALDATAESAKGKDNVYASAEDITVNNVTWNVTGNSTMTPWRIGGKNLTSADRTVYSKTAISGSVKTVQLTVGAAASVTVNSARLEVYSSLEKANQGGTGDVATKDFEWSINSTLTVESDEGTVWTDRYYAFVFTVTIGGSNKFIEFKGVEFFAESNVVTPSISVTGVELNKTNTSIEIDNTEQLTATISPSNATNTNVVWTSSDTNVATVSNSGLVTAIDEGTTTITVTTRDGSFTASCVVTVPAPSFADVLNLHNAKRYISNGSYYLHSNGSSKLPSAVLGDAEDAPTLLTFKLVGDNAYKIVDPDGKFLSTTDKNDALRFGTTPSIWNVSSGSNDEMNISTVLSDSVTRVLSLYTATTGPQDFRTYKTGSASCTTVKLASEIVVDTSSVSIVEEGPITITEGDTTTINANAVGGVLSWTVSDSTKATITDNGDGSCSVTGVLAGEVTVFAHVGDKTASISITIEAAANDVELEGDILTRESTGIENGSSSYGAWKKKTLENSYSGSSAGGYDSIQLRTSNSNSGIISTGLGKAIRKVSVKWDSHTAAGRTIDIYASNTPYSSVEDLFNDEKCGTKVGSLTYGQDNATITIEGDYQFVGVRSSSSALYLSEIAFVWEQHDFPMITLKDSKTLTSSWTKGYCEHGTDADYTLNSAVRFVGSVAEDVFDDISEIGFVITITKTDAEPVTVTRKSGLSLYSTIDDSQNGHIDFGSEAIYSPESGFMSFGLIISEITSAYDGTIDFTPYAVIGGMKYVCDTTQIIVVDGDVA